MRTNDFALAIEAIGQKTTIGAISSADGNLLHAIRINQGASYHTTSRESLRPLVYDLFSSLLGFVGVGIDECDRYRACIGLSGVTFDYDRQHGLPHLLRSIGIPKRARIICTGDAEIAFYGQTQGNFGSGILCHSGSTAFACNESRFIRIGGWGPAFGDEGSAFWMGRETLRTIAGQFDTAGSISNSVLWEEVNKWFSDKDKSDDDLADGVDYWVRYTDRIRGAGCDLRIALFHFVHRLIRTESFSTRRAIICHVVRPLMQAWEKGDLFASQIVYSAGVHLAEQYQLAIQRSGLDPSSGPIVLYGGVFFYHHNFSLLVERLIQERLGSSDLRFIHHGISESVRPVCGALLLALGNAGGSHYTMPERTVIENVLRTSRLHPILEND